jgi:hypothetical protein
MVVYFCSFSNSLEQPMCFELIIALMIKKLNPMSADMGTNLSPNPRVIRHLITLKNETRSFVIVTLNFI